LKEKRNTKQETNFSYFSGHDSRMFAKESIRKAGGSRKTLTDLTDSGVSVVSDTPPCPVKDSSRVISWLIQSETQVSSSVNYSHSDSSSKHRARSTTSSGNSNLQRQA
jgi:axin 1